MHPWIGILCDRFGLIIVIVMTYSKDTDTDGKNSYIRNQGWKWEEWNEDDLRVLDVPIAGSGPQCQDIFNRGGSWDMLGVKWN
jgi:hypothetical protein